MLTISYSNREKRIQAPSSLEEFKTICKTHYSKLGNRPLKLSYVDAEDDDICVED
jgi:hypothetical protein